MISILLASYNGEKYIAEQIDSLICQTYQDFKLFISDDCSTDATFQIAKEYAKKHPAKIFAVQNEENSGSAKHNFMRMMIERKDDYMMLCDQDDVWLPGKIESTLAKMKDMEALFGSHTPILVHTDLRVVNDKLETISPSYKAAMNANFKKTKLRNQVIQNTLAGCTAMYNRTLADLVTETPEFMVMHDWWLNITASAFGKIVALDEQTVLYRQHGGNEIGANEINSIKGKARKSRQGNEIRKALKDTYPQAQSFLDTYSDKLTKKQQRLLRTYSDIPNHSKLIRCITICRLGTLKNGLARKIAQTIWV